MVYKVLFNSAMRINTVNRILLISFIVLITGSFLTGADINDNSVKNMIGISESRLASYIEEHHPQAVKDDISQIEKTIGKSKRLLSEGKTSEAYYIISLTAPQFKKLQARIEYQQTLNKYNELEGHISVPEVSK